MSKNLKNKYKVEITESLQKQVYVIAAFEEDALEKITELYGNGDITLDDSDYIGSRIDIVNYYNITYNS